MDRTCILDFDTWLDFQPLHPVRDPDPLWAFNEFSNARLNDQRLTSRLQSLARQFEQQPMASIPQACGDWSQSKAAYRFCANDKVQFEAILQAHYARTVERAGLSAAEVILCPQDTTTLSYWTHPATRGLGHLGTKAGKSLGLLAHSTLAVGAQGQIFGLLQVHCWNRPRGKRRGRTRNRHSRHAKKLQQKETARWLNSFLRVEEAARQSPWQQWVSVCDREGDLFELLHQATQPTCLAGLLVRARHDRSLANAQGKQTKKRLFRFVQRLPSGGTYTIGVPRREGQPARQATLSLSWSQVSLAAPCEHRGLGPVRLWVVYAKEVAPPPGHKAICWCLLSTVPVRNLAEAIRSLEWYVKRWTIEEFHRVLKSGCRVEARQLMSRQRLQRALAIDMVVAWRIMDLNKAARLEPDAPADRWLSQAQWQALYCYRHQTAQAPPTPPTIAQAVLWIAQLGGFLARKSDGRPGTTTLWRGLQRLKDLVEAWEAFGPGHHNDPTPIKKPPKRRRKPAKRCG